MPRRVVPFAFASFLALTTWTVQAAPSAPVIGSYTAAVVKPAGGNATLTVSASGDPTPKYQWLRVGTMISGATASTLTVSGLEPGDTGLYSAVASNTEGSASIVSIVGLSTDRKVIGSGTELTPVDIHHPNGNIFDQVLVTGASESITADAGQITRTSYIDIDGDIVQVEFSGPGTLSLVLASPTGPAVAEKYNQPTVNYMKGHAGIVIAGATENTHVSVFTVGRATAFDPNGGYDITKPISATNNPDNNHSPLFDGHSTTTYDGVADLAFIAIMSSNQKFGSLRAANVSFFASKGHTGIYARGVTFTGPVRVGDISAFDAAEPVLYLGSAADVSITGGDLYQDNGKPVQVNGMDQLKFVAGTDSHGHAIAAKQNRAVLMQNGQNVTSKIVVNP
ncbi:immunoglobulin domain-containing protein [Opitutus terrae]|uniref:immunoglobulin domain-containing protein n=1 Tax=Opitutus terrae TaxID=107709 RepID=UPI000326BC39|nr:immunoglobulin domain-containing protein [Opitutus terrae]